MDRSELGRRVNAALDYHHRGYNCAQSTALALADLCDVGPDELYRLMEGFGGGMGGFSETCGAISGAIAVVSARESGGMGAPITKHATYGRIKKLVDAFREENGSTVCPTLKGLDGAPAARSCDDYVACGVRLACTLIDDEDCASR